MAPSLAQEKFLPLPSQVLNTSPMENPALDLTDVAIRSMSELGTPRIPEALSIENEGGSISFDQDKRVLTYTGGKGRVHLRTSDGTDVNAHTIQAGLDDSIASLTGPLIVYQGETLTRAENGRYNWKSEELDIYGVRTKVQGMLVRGSHIEYRKDAEGKQYMKIHDAYVSTEDVQEPSSWIGAGELTVYPGDYGRLTRLSIASGNADIPVPILGWFSFSHSLNPREGYMPHPGAKSIWGAYLLNSYGFLLGNRRVENGMPVSDYILTANVDYRARRGLGLGLDFENVAMTKRAPEMTGLSLYYAADSDPMINPTNTPREHTRHNRYRLAMQTLWNLDKPTPDTNTHAHWTLGTNINAVSDKYMLRDFFEDIGRNNDKPDNTVRLERRTRRSQTMLTTRFAANDFYATDERLEASYYRVRSTIGNSRISYETRSSLAAMQQYLPSELKFEYEWQLSNLRTKEMQDYYRRLLNTQAYLRFNTTHEFSTSFNILRFLNVTPKAGGGYSGYYDVEGVGSDNRFLGYAACDFDIKFHRSYDGFRIPKLGMKGLTHIFHPYTTFAHCNISSSNNLVPKMDTWSNIVGNSTNNPMSLDLIGFTSIDAWGTWSVWRFGAQNVLSTTVDGSPYTLLHWNIFIDYNEENPNTNNNFSNLFSEVTLRPTERLSVRFESQTPTIREGDGFSQYNTSIAYQPVRWFEGRLGHRYLSSHPFHQDASQMYLQANLRINEKYSLYGRWYWDIEEKRFPIQQYSIFRRSGPWYVGASLFLRNNGGKKETGVGISFTLGETGTALPINFF